MCNNLKIIDSHAHLDFNEIESDIENVINRAKKNGVEEIITISTKLSKINKIISLANKYKNIWFSVGIHPHEAENDLDSCNTEKIIEYAKNKKCVAIGEAGLDYHYCNASPLSQKYSFESQILAAHILNLPIIIHSRDADIDLFTIIKNEMKKNKFNGVLHCYSSGRELALNSIDLGLYISFSGILTFKNSIELQKLAYEIPLNKILIETDSPFLSPVPNRGKINEPSNVYYILKKLSEIRGIDIKDLAKIIRENTLNLFKRINSDAKKV